jgi:hypothetical protein
LWWLADNRVHLRHHRILLKVGKILGWLEESDRLTLPVIETTLYLRQRLRLLSLINWLRNHYLLRRLVQHMDWLLLMIMLHLHLNWHFLTLPLCSLNSVHFLLHVVSIHVNCVVRVIFCNVIWLFLFVKATHLLTFEHFRS